MYVCKHIHVVKNYIYDTRVYSSKLHINLSSIKFGVIFFLQYSCQFSIIIIIIILALLPVASILELRFYFPTYTTTSQLYIYFLLHNFSRSSASLVARPLARMSPFTTSSQDFLGLPLLSGPGGGGMSRHLFPSFHVFIFDAFFLFDVYINI